RLRTRLPQMLKRARAPELAAQTDPLAVERPQAAEARAVEAALKQGAAGPVGQPDTHASQPRSRATGRRAERPGHRGRLCGGRRCKYSTMATPASSDKLQHR